jgi:hypothetical protein
MLPLANVEIIFPFMLGGLVLVTPIVAIMAHHQRKMAEIIHGTKDRASLASAAEGQLLHEVSRLRDVVNQQTMALENLAKSHRDLEARLASTNELRDHLSA